jgi:hypothetical protein
MNKIGSLVLAVVALMSVAGDASAQQIYLDFGPTPPGYGPGYGPPPPGYGPGYGPPPGPYYRSYRGGGGGGYYPPGRFRTWNGCQQGWTVQDGLCKPYRGY